jgi:hypothetical protein
MVSRSRRTPLSDNFDVRKRKNEFRAARDRFGLPLKEFIPEMPGKNQIVIWAHGPRLFFRDDRDFSADRLCAIFFWVSIRRAGNDCMIDSAPLQNSVTFCGGSLNMY